jgi:hypothetical protein
MYLTLSYEVCLMMYTSVLCAYRHHTDGPAQKCRIIIIFVKSQFGKINFNLHYFN